MRKRYRVLILAAFVAALAVPLGFALSLESSSAAAVASHVAEAAVVSASAKTTAAILMPPARPPSPVLPFSDGTKLLFVGSALVGLATAMRRAR